MLDKINKDYKAHFALSNWLEENYLKEIFHPGFERMALAFSSFKKEFKRRNIKIITIAGTNGKGGVSFGLYNLLKKEKRVALWSSPHILSPVERFQLPSGFVDASRLLLTFQKCHKQLVQEDNNLSFYEFLFFCFCELALDEKVDILILEVGMGGRLDAVNVFDPHLTCITSISRDHINFLGNSYKSILKEKLGIARSAVPLITSLELLFLRQECEKFCAEKQIPWKDIYPKNIDSEGPSYKDLNQNMAKELYKKIKLKKSADLREGEHKKVRENLGKGRWEKVTIGNRSFIFIGAHNLDGMRKFVGRAAFDEFKINALCKKEEALNVYEFWLGLSDRELVELKNIVAALICFTGPKKIHLFSFNHPRAISFKKLKILKESFDQRVVLSLDLFDEIKRTENEKNKVVVTGSNYFIGEVQKLLLNHYPSHSHKLLP